MKTLHCAAVCLGTSILLLQSVASADSSTFSTSSAGGNDWSSQSSSSVQSSAQSHQARGNQQNLGIGLSLGALVVGGRWEIDNGGVLGLDVVWRKSLGRGNLKQDSRIEVGGLCRFGFTPEAVMIGGGIPFRLILGMHPNLETAFGIELSYTRMYFSQPFFVPRNGMVATLRWDVGYYVDPRVSIGITPLAFSAIAGDRVNTFFTYEPGVFARFSPI